MLPIDSAIQKYDGKHHCSDGVNLDEIDKTYLLLTDDEGYADSRHRKEYANYQSVDDRQTKIVYPSGS